MTTLTRRGQYQLFDDLPAELAGRPDHRYIGRWEPAGGLTRRIELTPATSRGLWHFACIEGALMAATTRLPITATEVPAYLSDMRIPQDSIEWRSEPCEPVALNPLDSGGCSPRGTGKDRIYFVEALHSGRIKIGVARDVPARFVQLNGVQAPEPLRLLGSIPGSYPLESALHRRFGAARVHGEWFAPAADLIDFIAGVL